MRVEIPGTRSKGLCFGDSPWLALIRNVTAVGHFTTVDNTLSFLSLVFLFVLFPNMWCSFILVIIPLRTFFHAPRCRRGSHHSVSATAPWFPVHWRYTHRPCCPRFDSSWFVFAWIPRIFHATILPPTPRFQPRQRHHIHHGNFRTRIPFCSGSYLGPSCSCWLSMKSVHFPLFLFHIDIPPCLPSTGCRC